MAKLPSAAGDRLRRRTASEVKVWVEEVTTTHRINQQSKIIHFLLSAYGALLLFTMIIFYLQGFRVWGFNLEPTLLKWLGGATLGEIAGLLGLTFGAVFKRPKN